MGPAGTCVGVTGIVVHTGLRRRFVLHTQFGFAVNYKIIDRGEVADDGSSFETGGLVDVGRDLSQSLQGCIGGFVGFRERRVALHYKC